MTIRLFFRSPHQKNTVEFFKNRKAQELFYALSASGVSPNIRRINKQQNLRRYVYKSIIYITRRKRSLFITLYDLKAGDFLKQTNTLKTFTLADYVLLKHLF